MPYLKITKKGEPDSKSLEQWFLSIYHDFVQSLIYLGQLEIDAIVQDFTYTYDTWSWSARDGVRLCYLMNENKYRLNGISESLK